MGEERDKLIRRLGGTPVSDQDFSDEALAAPRMEYYAGRGRLPPETEAMTLWNAPDFSPNDKVSVAAVEAKLEEPVTRDPSYSLAHCNRGTLLLTTFSHAATNDQARHRFGRLDPAIVERAREAAQEATNFLKESPESLYALAFAWHCTETLEDIMRGRAVYEKITDGEPKKYVAVHNNLGSSYRLQHGFLEGEDETGTPHPEPDHDGASANPYPAGVEGPRTRAHRFHELALATIDNEDHRRNLVADFSGCCGRPRQNPHHSGGRPIRPCSRPSDRGRLLVRAREDPPRKRPPRKRPGGQEVGPSPHAAVPKKHGRI